MSTGSNSSSNSACEIISTSQKRKGFHGKYLDICKFKNIQPLAEVKSKQKNNIYVLDFHADRVKVNDWFAICKALETDKTLKFVAIRLRKNDGNVLEEIDTLKKAREVSVHPVIYSKFVFVALIESLQSMLLVNNSIETLVLEGLPISARYMVTLSKGLFSNHSIKTLSFTRSIIGDESCSILCTNIKHLSNIDTLILNNCNLSEIAADAVKDFIKSQKIQRFSEAWIRSLRYQNIESTPLDGLRKIVLNNNPSIGDSGLEILKNELLEDVWIKEIEMQNCGLTELGAQYVIEILKTNKTITMFDVSNNSDMPEYLHRQIMIQSGVSFDLVSADMRPLRNKITKTQMLDKLKFMEEQLESEIARRKQLEDMNDQLYKQVIESQKELCEKQAFIVPEGYKIIKKDYLIELLNGTSFYESNVKPLAEKTALNIVKKLRRRKRRSAIPKKAKSLIIQGPSESKLKSSLSEPLFQPVAVNDDKKKAFIEQNIGDYFHNNDCEIENVECEAEKPLKNESKDDDDDKELLSKFFRKKSQYVTSSSDE